MPTALATKSDAQIKTDVLNELKWDATVDETEVGVQVKDGIVTLTGNISAYPKKLAARDAAHRVWGVRDVVDDMKIRIPATWERTDEDVAKAVRSALKWDVLVPDDKIATTVSNGTVTLLGSVNTWMQRYDAERCVHRLAGVKGVINQIAVAGPQVDPTKIKREIEDALERQSEREAKRIGVTVRDGVVTITGTVRSWGEKNAIERAVLYTTGVRRVDDRTTVDPYQ
ncbi:MAG: BON domain-containing protein [Phycisphaeraceae bacterium]|nr:BON domain-containing protein [Phycisphaeraceae bacterium]